MPRSWSELPALSRAGFLQAIAWKASGGPSRVAGISCALDLLGRLYSGLGDDLRLGCSCGGRNGGVHESGSERPGCIGFVQPAR